MIMLAIEKYLCSLCFLFSRRRPSAEPWRQPWSVLVSAFFRLSSLPLES